MMGYKWKLFLLQFTFIPWHILSILTFKLSNVFYFDAYREAIYSAFYMNIRKISKDKSLYNINLLNDNLLDGKATYDVYPEEEIKNRFSSYTKIDSLNYNRDYSIISLILLFFTILYFVGGIISVIVIYLTKYINAKYILILSSIIFSISFYFMSTMDKTISNLIIFSVIYGIGSYSYHSLRHYFAIKAMDKEKKKEIGSILIFSNIGLIVAPIIVSYVTKKLSLIVLAIIVIVLSVVAVIPLFKLDIKENNNIIKYQKIEKNKLLFFILEQAKVINLSLQPLYLYLFINNKIEYVGIFNAIMGVSACIFIYFFVRKIDDNKYFKYLNILFCIILLLKLNITSNYLILVIGFFEGLGIKMFEIVSAENIYNIKKDTNIKGYIVLVEIIFCFTRSIFCLIGYFINDIKIILYISIVLIFIISFIKRKEVKDIF